jgi:anti-sigma28 factor (negative regulator of flagellin synthesis)
VADEAKSGDKDKAPPRKSGAKTQRERAEEKREEKLALIREQIEDGTLTIRQMTPEERKKDPPRKREPRRRRS